MRTPPAKKLDKRGVEIPDHVSGVFDDARIISDVRDSVKMLMGEVKELATRAVGVYVNVQECTEALQATSTPASRPNCSVPACRRKTRRPAASPIA